MKTAEKQNKEKINYINLLSDMGFKRSFAEDGCQNVIRKFINDFISKEIQRTVESIEYLPNDKFDKSSAEHKASFDVLCKDQEDSYFIVEMQRVRQAFPVDRAIGYASRMLSEGFRIEDDKYVVPKVYTICIMENGDATTRKRNKCFWSAKLRDEESRIISDNPTFFFIELSIFAKSIEELLDEQEKWMYLLLNMGKLEEEQIKVFNDKVFQKVFERCNYSKFTDMEKQEYEKSIWEYIDVKSGLEAAKRDSYIEGKADGISVGIAEGHAKGLAEGKAEGIAEGIAEGEAKERLALAKAMLLKGIDIALVTSITGLSEEEIIVKN